MSPEWTIVQHSGYGYGGDEGFRHAVEVRQVSTRAEKARVASAGGMLFPSWRAADDYCDSANYPPEVSGLYPRARGSFSTHKVDGLAIYRAGEAL